MYSKNGKIILEPADIPCRFMTTIPDAAGGAFGCFSPACEFNVLCGETVFDMDKCGPSCVNYKREDIASCPRHGQYIASHGCLMCDVEGAKK